MRVLTSMTPLLLLLCFPIMRNYHLVCNVGLLYHLSCQLLSECTSAHVVVSFSLNGRSRLSATVGLLRRPQDPLHPFALRRADRHVCSVWGHVYSMARGSVDTDNRRQQVKGHADTRDG